MDPTGHAKVTPDDISLPDYEINILSPIRGTYQNNHLFYFPEAYERLFKKITIKLWVISISLIDLYLKLILAHLLILL
jgi:hypothetical protein